jgi:membrane protease YdiL (CAAX protease family)
MTTDRTTTAKPAVSATPWRWFELVALFVAAPLILRVTPARLLIPQIVVGAAGCLAMLLRDRTFDRRRLWGLSGQGRALRRAALRFLVLAPLLAGLIAWLRPDAFADLPRNRPLIWGMVMVAYPILSVYPQELIFRTYFFHRYQGILANESALAIGSALAFGWAHVVLGNGIAMALSTVGGLMFAGTYARSHSTAAVGIEHALWGCAVFTMGLGSFFYAGASRP